MENKIQAAQQKFEALLRSQLERVQRMKAQKDFIDYGALDKLIIGFSSGMR